MIAGGAAQRAASTLREKVAQVAAQLLEVSPEDLEVEESRVQVRGTPSRALSFADVAATAYLNPDGLPLGLEPGLEASVRFKPTNMFTFSNACHCLVVEVDRDTGAVGILRYIVSEDCGTMINPNVVEGQIAGGVVQGIGEALLEEMSYDEQGNPLASTFLDYLLPTAGDTPNLEYGHIETASTNPGGYKGMGEGGAIASPAAIGNAVNDALAGIGGVLTELPLTPSRVLAALTESTQGASPRG